MKMKIRNKAAFTDVETGLERDNRRISYEAALEGIVLLEMMGPCRLSRERSHCTVRVRG